MATATFAQIEGTLNTYRNTTDEPMPPGTIVTIGARIGIAAAGIAPQNTGAVNMTGIYALPKGDGEIAMGTELIWDGDKAIPGTPAEGTPAAGYAAADAAATDTIVPVVINA